MERARLGTLARRLNPAGALWHVGPPASAEAVRAAWTGEDAAVDRDAALSLAFRHVMAAEALLERDPPGAEARELARFHLERARRLIPGGEDAWLNMLEQRFEPSSPPSGATHPPMPSPAQGL